MGRKSRCDGFQDFVRDTAFAEYRFFVSLSLKKPLFGAGVFFASCRSHTKSFQDDRASVADSAAASRKPKMAGVGAAVAEGLADGFDGAAEPENKRAEERSAAETSFMGSEVKVSKVAQTPD